MDGTTISGGIQTKTLGQDIDVTNMGLSGASFNLYALGDNTRVSVSFRDVSASGESGNHWMSLSADNIQATFGAKNGELLRVIESGATGTYSELYNKGDDLASYLGMPTFSNYGFSVAGGEISGLTSSGLTTQSIQGDLMDQ